MYPLRVSHLNAMIPSLRQIPMNANASTSFSAFQTLLSTRKVSLFTHRVTKRKNAAPWETSFNKSIGSARFSNCAAEQQERYTTSEETPKILQQEACMETKHETQRESACFWQKRQRRIIKEVMCSWYTAHARLLPLTCAPTHSPADIPVMARVIYFSWCALGWGGFGISVCVWVCVIVFMHVHSSVYVFVCVSVLHLGRVKELSGQITSLPLLGFLCLSVSAQMKICSTQITRVPSHRFLGNPSCLKPGVAVLIVRVCVCRWMSVFCVAFVTIGDAISVWRQQYVADWTFFCVCCMGRTYLWGIMWFVCSC